MSEPDLVGKIFGWVGTVIATYFYIAPVVPFWKVLNHKLDYKDSPGVLLIMSFMNCILWADYGLVKNDFMVYFANGIGGTITLVFISVYLVFLAKESIPLSLGYIALLIAVIFGIMIGFFLIDYNITGYVAMIFNVLMYAAPGEKIFQVIKTSNYNLIPIFSTMGGLACSLCWLMYGIYQRDWKLYVPNALGLAFAVLQVVIYLIYYLKNKKQGENNAFPGENDEVV
jgi:solute carrier family 50 protein (sugar transporter)